jgi:hypothetical protein
VHTPKENIRKTEERAEMSDVKGTIAREPRPDLGRCRSQDWAGRLRGRGFRSRRCSRWVSGSWARTGPPPCTQGHTAYKDIQYKRSILDIVMIRTGVLTGKVDVSQRDSMRDIG